MIDSFPKTGYNRIIFKVSYQSFLQKGLIRWQVL